MRDEKIEPISPIVRYVHARHDKDPSFNYVQLAKELGISKQTLFDRIRSGNWGIAWISGAYTMYNAGSSTEIKPLEGLKCKEK